MIAQLLIHIDYGDIASKRGKEHAAALPETGPSTAYAVAYEWTAKQRKSGACD